MPPTTLLYLEDFIKLQSPARIVTLQPNEDGRTTIVLDQTVFYPQGGGQPYDQGKITGTRGTFVVEEVRFVEGLVHHIGHYEQGAFQAEDTVECHVEPARRLLHSRLHSAGHVVDMALQTLGIGWIPGKGYHFPNGPYVEYAGDVNPEEKEKRRSEIEKACQTIIAKDAQTTLRFMDVEEMKAVCHFVPENLPTGKPMRVVLYGDFGVPCGGTHVAHLGEIGKMTIRKIKNDRANIRIAYDVDRTTTAASFL